MSPPIPVLPLQRGADGVWEAVVTEVHGGGDLDVRDTLDPARGVRASVRVGDELKTLTVFEEADGTAVVRYDDALPGA